MIRSSDNRNMSDMEGLYTGQIEALKRKIRELEATNLNLKRTVTNLIGHDQEEVIEAEYVR